MPSKNSFLQKAKQKTFNKKHQKTIAFNIGKYDVSVSNGKKQYADLEAVKRYAKNVKWQAIENLADYLEEFERNFTKKGGKVIWAKTAQEATEAVLQIATERNAKLVVKAKSMVTEEIALNEALKQHNIETLETDLGEYIVQLAGEKPYHIVTPAMHKSKEDIAELFHEKLQTPLEATPEQLTLAARKKLRSAFLKADIGITGANFLVADIGGIALTENEGNIRIVSTYPKVHIAIAGIEKVLPSLDNLAHFWPLLATYGTGQNMTTYNTIVSGAKQKGEIDGPEEMYVILLDNGRSKMLADKKRREALYCIRCGACLNACPVYHHVGGHAYESAYAGPIGAVVSPHLHQQQHYKHLSHASSLCGKCTEVCPMNISLHELLLENRQFFHSESALTKAERNEQLMWRFWEKAMLNRSFMNFGGRRLRQWIFKKMFADTWGEHRELLKFPKKSFNELWKAGKV